MFGFLAAGAVGWLIFDPSPKFALWGASVGFLTVLMGDFPDCLKRHLTVNLRRSFWAGYLLALGRLTIGVVGIILMLLLFVAAGPVLTAITGSTTDALTLAGDMLGFWAYTSLRFVAGVWLTSVASIALLTAYVMLKRKLCGEGCD
jgi:hypothetical protein